MKADMSDEGHVADMFGKVLSEYGWIDFLVNNAGIQIAADTHELPIEQFDKALAVNLPGAFLCAQQAVRHAVEAGVAAPSSTCRACTN